MTYVDVTGVNKLFCQQSLRKTHQNVIRVVNTYIPVFNLNTGIRGLDKTRNLVYCTH